MERIEPIQNISKQKVNLIGLRTNFPRVLGVSAIIALFATLGWVVWSAASNKNRSFILKGKEQQLSSEVIAVVNGYHRDEIDGSVLKYSITADKATSFSDNHQELEHSVIKVYDELGDKYDQISSDFAIYVPNSNDSKLFNAKFTGNVNIETRDGLNVKSEIFTYDRETEIAESDQVVEFRRDNISGTSVGVTVNLRDKQIELLHDVEIQANADPNLPDDKVGGAKLQRAQFKSGSAKIWQNTEGEQFIDAKYNVVINLVPLNNQNQIKQPTDVKADEVLAYLTKNEIRKLDLNGNSEVFAKATASNPETTKVNADKITANFAVELENVTANGGVKIESTHNGQPSKIVGQSAFYNKTVEKFEIKDNVEIVTSKDNQPTVIHSNYALYDKKNDVFELKNGVDMTTVEDKQPTKIHSQDAVYDQTNGKITLTGEAQVTQADDFIKGDLIIAILNPNKKVRNAYAKGNAYLKQNTPERTTEISGNELNATFNDNQQMITANSIGTSNVVMVPNQSQDYSKATMISPNGIHILFDANGAMNQMQTEGRTTIKMDAPDKSPDAANKRLTANSIKTFFNANGKDLKRVEAIGAGELIVEPLNASASNYKTTVTANRFDCDFYESGNIARNCVGTASAKVVRVPTVQQNDRGIQTLTANKLNALFQQKNQQIQQLDAQGNAKFNELDRNGLSEQMTYTASDGVIQMRGGEPTVFDSRARAKASEIDWDTKSQKSFLRNKVATTYYSQKQTNGSMPFSKVNAPVFVTADQSQFDHQKSVGIYSGNARAWQDNNYVRADQLVIFEKEGRFEGDGNVQSLLYNATKKENGKVTNEPASVTAEKIAYWDKDKRIQYQNSVDIRQGSDRITGGIADLYLTGNNVLKEAIVQENVVMTQPNRKIRGTWAQYTAADESVILKGNPAIVEDAEQGTTQGTQLNVSKKENRVVNLGATKQGASGRTRTVYKIKN